MSYTHDKILERSAEQLHVASSVGSREEMLIQEIGGMFLLSVSGHEAPRGLECAVDYAITAFDKDLWKDDIAYWIDKRVNTGEPADVSDLTDMAYRGISMVDSYREQVAIINDVEAEASEIMRNVGKAEHAVDRTRDAIENAIKKYGMDELRTNRELYTRVLEEASETYSTTDEMVEAESAEKAAEAEARTEELEATLGAELEEFKANRPESVALLMPVLRELIRAEIIVPGASIERVAAEHVTLAPYPGSSDKKLAVRVTKSLNGLHLPMSYQEASEFTDRIRQEASVNRSIWS